MNSLIAQLKKDLISIAPWILAYLALLLVAFIDLTVDGELSSNLIRYGSQVLLMLTIALLFLSDSPTHSYAWWKTQPVNRWVLVASKLTITLFGLLLPMLIVQSLMLLQHQYEGDVLKMGIADSAIWIVTLMIAAMLPALVAQSTGQWLLMLVIGFVAGIYLTGMTMGFVVSQGTSLETVKLNYFLIGCGAVLIALVTRYMHHSARHGVVFCVMAALLIMGVYRMPGSFINHANAAPINALSNSSVAVDLPEFSLSQQSACQKRINCIEWVKAPTASPAVTVRSLHPDMEIQFESIRATLKFADGTILQENTNLASGSLSYSFSGVQARQAVIGLEPVSAEQMYTFNQLPFLFDPALKAHHQQQAQLSLEVMYSLHQYIEVAVLPAEPGATFGDGQMTTRIEALRLGHDSLNLVYDTQRIHSGHSPLPDRSLVLLRNPVRKEVISRWQSQSNNRSDRKPGLLLQTPEIRVRRTEMGHRSVSWYGMNESTDHPGTYREASLPLPDGWLEESEVVFFERRPIGRHSTTVNLDTYTVLAGGS